MASIRETLVGLIGGKALYGRDDYGPDPEVHPNPHTKIANRAARTHGQAYGGDQAIDWVHDCVRLIMETASNAGWYFERDGKRLTMPNDVDAEEGAEEAPADLCALLNEPNPYMDYVEFLELSIIDLLLAGEFFWLMHAQVEPGKPAAMYRLSPELLEIETDPKKFIKFYWYTPKGATDAVKFKPEEIIHAKLPNPHNEYRGLGVIAGGPRVFDVELAMTESQAQYFEQGTKLTGVLSSERRVPEPVFKRIRRQFTNMYSGARNAYKVAVLESGLKFQALQATATEAGYEALSRHSRDRIHRMFRVPPVLTALDETGNKDIIREGQRVFDTKTMRPFLNKIEKIVTRGLTHAWDVEFKIDYQYVMPDEDRLALADKLSTMPGIKTKEIRKMAGLTPSTGDPELDERVLNMPDTMEEKLALAEAEAKMAAKVMPHGGEGGRPPNPANRGGNQPVPGGGSGKPRQRGTYATSQARLREKRSQQKAMSEQDVLAIIDPLRSARQPTIQLMAHNIAEELRPLSRELEKAIEKALIGDDVKGLSDIVKKIRSHRAWRVFGAQASDVFMRAAKDAVDLARNQHRLMGAEFESADDFDIVQVAAGLVSRENGVKSIVGTLKDRVLAQVSEGVARNYSTEQIVNGVPGDDFEGLRSEWVGWRRGQAETIAATEAQEYYNEGALQVAERTEHSHVFVVDGEDHDEPCVEANGQVWPIEYARERRTEHPRCTRTFYPMPLGADEA